MDGPCRPLPARDLAKLADAELMRLVAAGDRAAFEVVYARHANAAYRVAARIVGSSSGAHDVVQESLLVLWRSDGYQWWRGSLRAFLLTIVRNRAIDVLRREARVGTDPDLGLVERLADSRLTDEEVEARERGRLLRSAVTTLPPAQSQAVQLAFFAGLSHTEIAARLEAPVGTVKARIRLGLQKLAPHLEAAGAA